MDEEESYELAPGHRITVTTSVAYLGGGIYGRRIQVGDARYSCSCGKLTNGDVEAAHYHSDLVTP